VPDQRTVLLLDGHSLAYRAFHALPDTLRTATGQLTNAVYGFTSMLVKLLVDRQPDAVIVAFDRGRDVERMAVFPEYKANRAETPDEFRPQVELIKQVLGALDIPVIEVEGVEADDVLATLATRAVAAGAHAYVVTGDRDAMQLVADDLTVLYTLRGMSDLAEMTPAAVTERYGVPPERYVELAALRGDTSDNLPGVPGVGDKTAAKLLMTFGDLDRVYEHLAEVPGKKVPAMLAEHRNQVLTNRAIMALRRDLDLDLDPTQIGPRAPTPPRSASCSGRWSSGRSTTACRPNCSARWRKHRTAGPARVPCPTGGMASWLRRRTARRGAGQLRGPGAAPAVDGGGPGRPGCRPRQRRSRPAAEEDLAALGDVAGGPRPAARDPRPQAARPRRAGTGLDGGRGHRGHRARGLPAGARAAQLHPGSAGDARARPLAGARGRPPGRR
jgi:5'-3' exonuclease